MDEGEGDHRHLKVLLVVGYLAVLLVLLLLPSPGAVVTLASIIWVGIGVVAAIRAVPPAGRRAREHDRGTPAPRRRRSDPPGQTPPRGRRGDNPHR